MKHKNQKIAIAVLLIVALLMINSKQPEGRSAAGYTLESNPTFTYTHNYYSSYLPNLKIGDSEFISDNMAYECGNVTLGTFNPELNRNCFSVKFTFEGKSYSARYGDIIQLNKYLQVQYLPSATVRVSKKEISSTRIDNPDKTFTTVRNYANVVTFYPESWTNTYKFTFTDIGFLGVNVEETQPLVKILSNENIELSINNDLANNISGGVSVYQQTTKVMTEELYSSDFEIPLQKGENLRNIPLYTGMLGQVYYSFKPYIYINVVNAIGRETAKRIESAKKYGETINYVSYTTYKFMKDSADSVNYNIVPNINLNVDTSIDCSAKICPTGFYCMHSDYEGSAYNLCMRNKPTVQHSFDQTNVVDVLDKKEQSPVLIIIGILLLVIIAIALIMKRQYE